MRGVKRVALEEKVWKAKDNAQILNDLLSEYKPFIQKAVYETCQRYVEWGRDEELSIGLLAFEEAIKRFDPNRGNFLSLARRTIRSRVIDYLRKEKTPFHTDIDDVKEQVVDQSVTNLIAEEITELQEELAKYDISFHDLPTISPVKRKLREELKQAAKVMATTPILINHFLQKEQLPVSALVKKTGISHKKVERNRTYLITLSMIWYLDLPLLQDYIK